MSAEGVTQGDPLSMFAYALGLLPLVKRIRALHPNIMNPWYADDTGMGGSFHDIKQCFTTLCDIGPGYGYYPSPPKSVLVVSQANMATAKATFGPNMSYSVGC